MKVFQCEERLKTETTFPTVSAAGGTMAQLVSIHELGFSDGMKTERLNRFF